MKKTTKESRHTFWRGVAAGIAFSLIAAGSAYLAILPGDIDFAVVAVALVGAVVLLHSREIAA